MGIPLGLAFASKSQDVTLVDVNPRAVEAINAGSLPFKEEGAEELLQKHIGRNLRATADTSVVAKQDVVVFVTGTPVDEHLNPKIHDVLKVISICLPLLSKRQLIVFRSTIFPGVTRIVEQLLVDGLREHVRLPDAGDRGAEVSAAEREQADIVCASRYMKGGRQYGGPKFKGFLSHTAGLMLRWFVYGFAHRGA